MENPFSIETTDHKKIYGVLHTPHQATNTAIILVHGLTGHMEEYIHLTNARIFERQGFAVIRFNQYSDLPDARPFHETTIRLHVTDTQSIIQYARQLGYNRIFLVGHSLGCPVSIAACNQEIAGLILWDPTASPAERIRDWETHDSAHNIAYLNWSLRIILGPQWIEDAKSFPDSFQQLSELPIPIKIIEAEFGGMKEHCKRYRKAVEGRHHYAIIQGAQHVFSELGTAEKLAQETLDWVKSINH